MPDFVVIGAQKSASTFLQDQMAQHPAVDLAEGEVRCFEDPFYDEQAVAALPSLFHGAPGAVRGIKRPDYLGRPEVPARLARHLPDARLFVVLREPVARAVSAYFHYVRHGFAPLLDIDEAFEALLAGTLATDFPRSTEILDYGLYGRHLGRWLQHFPREHLLVLDQKQLTGDPAPCLQRAFDLIGVDASFTPASTTTVSNRGVYAPYRLRLLRTKNRFVYEYSPTRDLRTPRRPTPFGWLYNASVVALDRGVLSRFDPGRPPALSPPVRARVQAYYDADREVLGDLLAGMAVDAAWL